MNIYDSLNYKLTINNSLAPCTRRKYVCERFRFFV